MLLRRFNALCIASLLVAGPVYSQTADSQGSLPVFQLRARTVVIDVVVTDGSDQPIGGLHKQDFQVLENNQPQTITYFEEHVGAPPDNTPPPPHDANVFTNVASAKTTDSVNVLLLDSLNTPLPDQSYVHNQTMKYLKNVEPGTRMAIFTLGNELRFVQGFTADTSLLSAALNNKGATPETSALLRTQSSKAGEASQLALANQMAELSASAGHGADPNIVAAMGALQDFQAETHSFELDQRVQQTLFALQQLARYLAGVPGRKNVIWFSGAFPVAVFPNAQNFNGVRSYDGMVRKTDQLLAAAQVSIYPIAAGGVANNSTMDVEHTLAGIDNAQDARMDQTNGLQEDALDRNASHIAMDVIAHDTGGQAFYGTNDLKTVIARVMHNGARYYTIAYTPTNIEMNGSYRSIQIKLENGPKYKLAYRRGYYGADSRGELIAGDKTIPDPLHPYMGHGMPDSTEIPYTLNLVPSAKQPPPDAPVAGDNAAFTSASKGPHTRYTATIWVPVSSLHLQATPDGLHQDEVETALVVYDHTGKALNWMVRMVNLSLKPERYEAAQQVGIPMRVEIDAPAGDVYLRTGIYEKSSHSAGTLEVPLSEVTPNVVASR